MKLQLGEQEIKEAITLWLNICNDTVVKKDAKFEFYCPDNYIVLEIAVKIDLK